MAAEITLNTPERHRAWRILESLNIRWSAPGEPISAMVSALEEVEHMRPVIDAAKRLVDAKSGVQRFNALCDIVATVEALRKGGR